MDMVAALEKFFEQEELEVTVETLYRDATVRNNMMDLLRDIIQSMRDSIMVEKYDRIIDTFGPAIIEYCQLYRFIQDMEGAVMRTSEVDASVDTQEGSEDEPKQIPLLDDYGLWVGHTLVSKPNAKVTPTEYAEEAIENNGVDEEFLRDIELFLSEFYPAVVVQTYLEPYRKLLEE